MNIDYNKYLNFYNDYKEKFRAAKTSVESYPCAELVKQIDEMINFLSTKKDITWEGSARAEFDDSINKCLDNLNAIKDSVNSVWKRAETIYKEIDSSLSDLYDNYITLVGVIKNGKPVVEDYEKIVKNADGTISVTTPGYNDAYTRWKYKCRVYDTSCQKICELIDQLLVELKKCDSEVISLTCASMVAYNGHLENLLEGGYVTTAVELIKKYEDSGKLINYRDEETGLLNVRYNQSMGPTIGGVNLAKSGCSIMSYASALTAIYTRRYEKDVYVLPDQIATAITENYGKLSRFFTPGVGFNGFATEKNITQDITGIYDVAILYSKGRNASGDGVITADQVLTVSQNQGCVVGSMQKKSHLVAITGVSNTGEEFVANTYSYAKGHISGAPEHTKLKYYSTVFDSSSVELKDGKVYLNGECNFDIGDITNVSIKGEDIPVERVVVNDDDLLPIYEYRYDVAM